MRPKFTLAEILGVSELEAERFRQEAQESYARQEVERRAWRDEMREDLDDISDLEGRLLFAVIDGEPYIGAYRRDETINFACLLELVLDDARGDVRNGEELDPKASDVLISRAILLERVASEVRQIASSRERMRDFQSCKTAEGFAARRFLTKEQLQVPFKKYLQTVDE